MRYLLIISFLAISISAYAVAKYESGSNDASSVVLYGKDGSSIVKVQVTSDGTMVLH